jgi:UDP-galactopyranose mutase
MLDIVDLLVVGAGPVGCVVAERAARVLGWNVLVIDRRPHIAGNCFDTMHTSGVRIHQYGPHYFRTRDASLLGYLSQFTDWIPARYIVKSFVRGRLFPFPINLTTLEEFFGRALDEEAARELLNEQRISIPVPRNSEELVLSRVGRELYEAFFLNYTQKQWQRHPRELDPEVCGRIPVRLDRDERYVDHPFQVMPKEGYTALFKNMLRHRKIRVQLGCGFHAVRDRIQPRRATVYTGPIDAYFDECFGPLPYRSLEFEFVRYKTEYVQPCVQINYPGLGPFTRSVEIKHVTGQRHPETVVSYETPRSQGEPYYPVPTAASRALYERYRELAEISTFHERVYFCGRLAQYRYFNMDDAIGEALQCFDRIRRECVQNRCASSRLRSAS